MITTSIGFIIGVEVSVENVAGETVYKPSRTLPQDLKLDFLMEAINPVFQALSNLSLRSKLPSTYYFTNKDKEVLTDGTPALNPWLPLSRKVRSHQNGIQYEMGALADFGGNIKRAIQYTDGSDPSHWQNETDKRLVSEADKTLLPKLIKYPVQSGINVLKAVLEDGSGIIKSINKSVNSNTSHLDLNFSVVDETSTSAQRIDKGSYALKITENSNPEIEYQVYLDDDLYNKYLFGTINIDLSETGSPFSLLDTNGFIQTRIDATDSKISHPIFELRFANRMTYWRYQKKNGFSASDITATAPHLKEEGDKLVSLKPKGLTETLVPFFNGTPKILPPPEIPSIKVENDRIFSEIFINQSNRLLNN